MSEELKTAEGSPTAAIPVGDEKTVPTPKKKKNSRLASKLIGACILLGVLICITSCYVGYNQYQAEIQKIYNDTAYQVAATALTYTNTDDLRTYVDIVEGYRDGTVTEDEVKAYVAEEKYQTVKSRLADLRESMGANDIFFVRVDKAELNNFQGDMKTWYPQLYIFDCYTVEELNYNLGDRGPLNPDFIGEANDVISTGERSDNYFISQSDYGYNTSALLPVKDDSGNVLVVIGVEIPMTTIQEALQQYIVNAVLVTVILIVVFLAAYVLFVYKSVINPIDRIASAVGGFLENNNQVSEELNEIKTKDEIQNLAENVLQMEKDLNAYIENLTHVTAEKERIGTELNVATNIQASMLPCIFPAFPDHDEFDIYATMNPAKEVGGDFYDFFMVDETHVAIVMADVSGKGVPAALFMVIAKTLIKDHTLPNEDLGAVFTKVNEILCESNSGGMFVTAFEGVLDLVTGEFLFVNAGHEMPFICRGGGTYEPYKIRAAFVLAGMEGMRYKAGSFTLEPGDKLFQYTDGVTEATNSSNELYGMDRLGNVLAANSDKSPMELLPKVKEDIDRFVAEAPQFDDITMLCLEYKKRGESKQ